MKGAQLPHRHGISQVMVLDSLMPALEQWLISHGLHLFKIPDGDDGPPDFTTYGVGITDARLAPR